MPSPNGHSVAVEGGCHAGPGCPGAQPLVPAGRSRQAAGNAPSPAPHWCSPPGAARRRRVRRPRGPAGQGEGRNDLGYPQTAGFQQRDVRACASTAVTSCSALVPSPCRLRAAGPSARAGAVVPGLRRTPQSQPVMTDYPLTSPLPLSRLLGPARPDGDLLAYSASALWYSLMLRQRARVSGTLTEVSPRSRPPSAAMTAVTSCAP